MWPFSSLKQCLHIGGTKKDYFVDGIAAHRNRDYATALTLYKKAAQEGNKDAPFYIAEIYNHDTGHYDEAAALCWYKQAAQSGILIALFQVAQAYLFGKGVERNIAEAVVWLEKCGTMPDALVRLIQVHKGGFGGSGAGILSPEKVFEYSLHIYEIEKKDDESEIGVLADDGIGAGLLGECYEHGIGTEKNEEKAIALYREQGDLYYRGGAYGHESQLEEAMIWYRKASALASV